MGDMGATAGFRGGPAAPGAPSFLDLIGWLGWRHPAPADVHAHVHVGHGVSEPHQQRVQRGEQPRETQPSGLAYAAHAITVTSGASLCCIGSSPKCHAM